MTTYKKFTMEIEINEFLLECEVCSMYDNCNQTYKECRLYNKSLWKSIDYNIRKLRKEVFNSLIK